MWARIMKVSNSGEGESNEQFWFSLTRVTIPSITEQPVKSLGRIFDCSLKDATCMQKTSKGHNAYLNEMDKTGQLGRFKDQV